MTQEPLNLDREEAISRLTGAIIGPPGEGVVAGSEADDLDTRQTCLVLTLSDAARANLHGALDLVKEVVGQAVVAAVRRWRTAGRTVIVADSGRPFFDADDLVEFAAFDVDVARAVEGVDRRRVRLYR
jgi:hypothetical protein